MITSNGAFVILAFETVFGILIVLPYMQGILWILLTKQTFLFVVPNVFKINVLFFLFFLVPNINRFKALITYLDLLRLSL